MKLALALAMVFGVACMGCDRHAPVPPPRPTDPLDLYPFLIGDHEFWPRREVLRGNGSLYQWWTGRDLVFVKGAPDRREWLTYDGHFFRLLQDCTGATGECASFAPGNIWAARYMRIGDVIDNIPSVIVRQRYMKPGGPCKEYWRGHGFHAVMTLCDAGRADFGGIVGTRDYVRLRYDPSDGVSGRAYEEFVYARDRGWVEWQSFNATTGAAMRRALFTELGGTAMMPVPPCTVNW